MGKDTKQVIPIHPSCEGYNGRAASSEEVYRARRSRRDGEGCYKVLNGPSRPVEMAHPFMEICRTDLEQRGESRK